MCGVLIASFHSTIVGCPFDDRRVIHLPDSNVVNERLGGGCVTQIFKD
jgi:hypothetical protein